MLILGIKINERFSFMKAKTRNFLKGYGSLLNVFRPAKSRSKEILAKSDAEQLYSDWLAVGNDMRSVMSTLSKDVKSYDKR